MTAQQVNDILGCGLEQAAGLLEAAGGDVGLAVELGMGMLGGADDDGGGGSNNGNLMDSAAQTTTAGSGGGGAAIASIWPERTPLPDSWKNQRLDDFVDGTDRIRQPLNGPCGVLSVIQAEMWRLTKDDEGAASCLTKALTSTLERISRQSGISKIQLKEDKELSLAQAAAEIRTAPEFLEAAVLFAGADKLSGGQASSLVEGPHWLCSSDLMCLLIRGQVGDGNFGAWNSITQQKQSFYPPDFSPDDCQIGILSIMENEQGVPVADDLKLGKSIWVVHTGDHFMTMKRRAVTKSTDGSNNGTVELELFNGLPPEGPRTKIFSLSGDLTMAGLAPPKQVDSFRKKRQGQPDDIVQAKKTDSTDYKEWTFEVVPAVDDPTVQGPMDDDPNEPVWSFSSGNDSAVATTPPRPSQGAVWRCASCYASRFQTMQFGQNDAGSTNCSGCGKSMAEAMWSVWLPFTELSPRMKRRARQMYAPKVELVIATLYPKAEITEEIVPMQ